MDEMLFPDDPSACTNLEWLEEAVSTPESGYVSDSSPKNVFFPDEEDNHLGKMRENHMQPAKSEDAHNLQLAKLDGKWYNPVPE